MQPQPAQQQPDPGVVIVGAGPVGLWTAIQIKKRQPHLDVLMYERHETYQRSHVLRLEHRSMLLYGKNSRDEAERAFYKDVTGKSLSGVFMSAAGGKSVFIRTNDLEAALKNHAQALGIRIAQARVESANALMAAHPRCKTFIAADGAHSKMRRDLLGEDAVEQKDLQHVVEVKYQAQGAAGHFSFLGGQHKTNLGLSHMAFEYVGREKEGLTPVTLRFFVDGDTYAGLPPASFKEPLSASDPRLPAGLARDIQAYMDARRDHAGETCLKESVKLTKLTLSTYAARKFAVQRDGRCWYIVGDAAMGVPYFRALNAGLITGSQLAYIVTREKLGNKARAIAYNALRPLDIGWEFAAARGKNAALEAYDAFRQASAILLGRAPDDDAFTQLQSPDPKPRKPSSN